MPNKRTDYSSWDDVFMQFSHTISTRSKDPITQVGATVVSSDNRVLSVGYNGSTKGFDDDVFPWGKSEDPLSNKHFFVVHAERNAILNFRGSNREFNGASIYVTHFPCHECAKEIAQVGISEVIYHDDHNMEETSLVIFKYAGIKVRKYQGDGVVLS